MEEEEQRKVAMMNMESGAKREGTAFLLLSLVKITGKGAGELNFVLVF